MFEISELKAKKLPELQDIAKTLNVPKYRTQKKLDLVYQILDHQAANPLKVKEIAKEDTSSPKPASEKEVTNRAGRTENTENKVTSNNVPTEKKDNEASAIT